MTNPFSFKGLLADYQISALCNGQKPMLDPYEPELIRKQNGIKVISYGQSSYGYDIRLSSTDFRIFQHVSWTDVDPKAFNQDFLVETNSRSEGTGEYFLIPAYSYGLGVSVERFNIPSNVTGVCLGKSTYARCGIIVNITPLEAGWKGYLTIEVSNSTPNPVRVYANEGIAQVLFFRGDFCDTDYNDRAGKYQAQKQEVTISRL